MRTIGSGGSSSAPCLPPAERLANACHYSAGKSRSRSVLRLVSFFLAASLLVGCETTNEPVRRELLGSWISNDLPGIVIRMTVAETARSVDGAGTLNEAQASHPFRVSGALAIDEVGLFFSFQERPDLAFLGVFTQADRIEGVLSGGEFSAVEVAFEREDLPR